MHLVYGCTEHARHVFQGNVCTDHSKLFVQEWTALAKMVFRLKPLRRNNPPINKWRLACYRAIHTKVCILPPVTGREELRQYMAGVQHTCSLSHDCVLYTLLHVLLHASWD